MPGDTRTEKTPPHLADPVAKLAWHGGKSAFKAGDPLSIETVNLEGPSDGQVGLQLPLRQARLPKLKMNTSLN